MDKNWCICNNSGIIFEDWAGDMALVCPICNIDGNKTSYKALIDIILNAKKNMRQIIRFRLNTHRMNLLRKSLSLNFVSFDDFTNKFYGIPIEIDNDIDGVQCDYV